MALKFLNKKGWHTGSLRNIENVWKAEQKHEAEQKKLDELRKQIHEERERSEFRMLQEQAGLVPKQERLDFLYDSGLAVGKGNSDGFKALESFPPKVDTDLPSSSNKQQQSSVPGALFEDKPQSANDAWRKLHSDPLLLIKQREQEALARVKNNPIQMAMIRKSVEAKKHKESTSDGEKKRDKHQHKKSKIKKKLSPKSKEQSSSEDEYAQREFEKWSSDKKKKHSHGALSDSVQKNLPTGSRRNNDRCQSENHYVKDKMDSGFAERAREDGRWHPSSPRKVYDASRVEAPNKRQKSIIKLSKEERAAKLKEMQMDAELHEEQRWKRLKQAEEDDAKEATRSRMSSGSNFLDAAHKSVYGADKGGIATIEESVRRRTHYSQRRSEGNAFKR